MQVLTDTRYLNVYVIMNELKKQIKNEQTYLATIQRQYDKRGGSTPLIRQTL